MGSYVTEVPLQWTEIRQTRKPLMSSLGALWGENSPETRSGSGVRTLKGRQSRMRRRKAEEENEDEKQTNKLKREEKPLQKLTLEKTSEPTRRTQKRAHGRRRDAEEKRGWTQEVRSPEIFTLQNHHSTFLEGRGIQDTAVFPERKAIS
ncbi:hypothetical protein NDU88_002006 [Pleurodeles waltl]|uniref:Uncharacterized protein n=1 Tax=Pleurodeles waltl TaxID=8319 RepID=A0AAV7R9M5_PLEWA|nr:hypothetical protein NDU88_002006 [Pleurodeles waltl]